MKKSAKKRDRGPSVKIEWDDYARMTELATSIGCFRKKVLGLALDALEQARKTGKGNQ